MIANLRVPLSRIFGGLLLMFFLVSRSAWVIDVPFVATVLFFLGTVLVGIAFLGRIWCSLYIAGYKKDHLVTQGPYSMCRNPLYFFSLIGSLGVGFATGCFLIPLLLFIGFCAYYPLVIKKEEAELLNLHNNDFESYMSRVPRFLPRISGLMEPETYIVKPVIFRKNIFNALWFIWFLGILEIIDRLHVVGVLPTIFYLY